MGNEDRKALMKNVASMPRDNEKRIEIHGGAGEKGIKVFKVALWKSKCQSYFNRYFKTSSIIVLPSDEDIIMNTLQSVCSENKSRGFVFKNYDILKHLKFLGYDRKLLEANVGAPPTSKSISYIAYAEQRNTVFICEKVLNGSNNDQLLKNIAVMVKYFLTLYDREIQASGLKIIGILVREKKPQGELIKCNFCHLFSTTYKDFLSPATFKIWLNSIETYEGWWNLANSKIQKKLFNDLAAEILCFMAVQKHCKTLTDDKSQQFKQAYFMYTPQQMDVHFSDAKHIIVQGSYGSGKSILGLKKLELLSKSLGSHEKIIYINFDYQSQLHLLMEKNLKEYAKIPRKKIKLVNGIPDILKSPSQSVYVCPNSARENLSAILEKTARLNINDSENPKTKYHLIVEEYDGETLTHDEAGKITRLLKSGDLIKSNIMLLAQPLTKMRSWNIGKKSYERETCMFYELENTFKIVQLKEVLRCCNEICEITKSTQNYLRNKDSVFTTEMDMLTSEQRQQSKESEKSRVAASQNFELVRKETISNSISDLSRAVKSLDHGMDLDQAFERSDLIGKINTSESKIVSKFGFVCEPSQGVDIGGFQPNLIEFSEDINLTSDVAVISLALVLRDFIGRNKMTTFLHISDKQPGLLRRSIQLLLKLEETFSYTQDIREYLHKNKQSKMLFSSNFRIVNGMEFDHVIIVASQSEYYLKYYIPQVISRCTYDLNFVLLPKEKIDETEETVANMIEELKHECLLKQTVIADCKACEKCQSCFSVSNETGNKQTFRIHTHSDQYSNYLFHLTNYPELDEQAHGDSILANAK